MVSPGWKCRVTRSQPSRSATFSGMPFTNRAVAGGPGGQPQRQCPFRGGGGLDGHVHHAVPGVARGHPHREVVTAVGAAGVLVQLQAVGVGAGDVVRQGGERSR